MSGVRNAAQRHDLILVRVTSKNEKSRLLSIALWVAHRMRWGEPADHRRGRRVRRRTDRPAARVASKPVAAGSGTATGGAAVSARATVGIAKPIALLAARAAP